MGSVNWTDICMTIVGGPTLIQLNNLTTAVGLFPADAAKYYYCSGRCRCCLGLRLLISDRLIDKENTSRYSIVSSLSAVNHVQRVERMRECSVDDTLWRELDRFLAGFPGGLYVCTWHEQARVRNRSSWGRDREQQSRSQGGGVCWRLQRHVNCGGVCTTQSSTL